MIALSAALGVFHVAQQRIHFRKREPAMGTHGAVAGHGGEQLILVLADPRGVSVLDQVGKHIAHQGLRIAAAEDCGHLADRHLLRTDPLDDETKLSERGGRGFHLVCFALTDRKGRRHEQTLRANARIVAGLLHALVGDALVRCMHVDDHQPFGVLRKDVDPMQLSNRIAERRHLLIRSRIAREGIGDGRICFAHALGKGPVTRHYFSDPRRRHGSARRGRRERRSYLTRLQPCETETSLLHRSHGLPHARLVKLTDAGKAILRAQFGKRLLEGTEQEIMHRALIAKAHLVLRRMNVDVDALGFDVEEQNERGMAAMVEHIGKGLAHCMRNRTVPDRAPVDEEVLHVRLGAREGWRRHPATELDPVDANVDTGGVLDERRAAHGGHASLLTQEIMRDVVALGDTAITAELERDVHASECEAAQHVLDARLLRPLRAQKLAPRWRVEEEVPNLDRGPHRVRRRHEIDVFGMAVDR